MNVLNHNNGVRNSFLRSLGMARISVNDVLKSPEWPEKWPYAPEDFKREDNDEDSCFYSQPRLVTHIDDYAIAALTQYYAKSLAADSAILDICSSWISHYPKHFRFNRAVGLGMNQFELSKNPQLTEFVVQDLNNNPQFPFEDNSFDFVTCVVSIDYLTRPLEVFSEIRRVLRPGGKAIISQSNRCFPTKVINIWLNTNDLQHIYIIGSYFHYTGGFSPPSSHDISPFPGRSDPMYIIEAHKI
jgi:SAM-dependent methyltransferase